MLLILSDKFLGKLRLELLKINFDKAKVLTIFILPIKVNFPVFQMFQNPFHILQLFVEIKLIGFGGIIGEENT